MLALPEPWTRAIVSAGVGTALLFYCFKDADFRSNRNYVSAGIIIGLLVVAGWLATGVLAADDFDGVRLASLTFIAPTGDTV